MPEGEYILITGASSGLGKELALLFARRRKNLLLTGRDATRLAAVVDEARAAGAEVRSRAIDLRNINDFQDWLAELGKENLVIAEVYPCAATNAISEVLDLSAEELREIYHVNILSIAVLLAHVIPSMVERGSGRIVLVSSVAAFSTFALASPYVAAKKGLHAIWLSLVDELSLHGIQVHISFPGAMDTPLFRRSNYHVSDPETVSSFLKDHLFYSIDPRIAARQLAASVEAGRKQSYFPLYARPLCAIAGRFDFVGRVLGERFIDEVLPISERKAGHRGRPFDFQNSTVIVTGAGSGIGKSLVLQLLAKGAIVIGLDFSTASLEALRKECGDSARLHLHESSVTDEARLFEVANLIEEKGLLPDLLINNAGVSSLSETHLLAFDQWRRILDTNYLGSLLCLTAFSRFLLKSPQGAVANIASIAGVGGYATSAPYAFSKGAIVGLTRSMQSEFDYRGLSLSLVCPSYVKTAIFREDAVPKSLVKNGIDKSFLSAAITSEQAAAAILRGLEKRSRTIVFPWDGKILFQIAKWIPAILGLFQRRLLRLFFKNTR